MDILVIISYVLGVLHLSESFCNYKQDRYWKRKYFRSYNGKDNPEVRCDKEGGHCLRYKEECNGRLEHWQTSCDHKCDCCFKSGKLSGLNKKRTSQWLLMKRRMTWQQAEKYCEAKRGDLLVPENVWDVIRYLREEDIVGGTDVWVGINDAYGGRFEGIHQNHVDNSAWQRGHPRNVARSRENCVVAEDREHDEGLKVEPCIAKNFFFCDFSRDRKLRYDVELIKEDNNYSNNEDNSAVYGKGIKISKERKSWKDARKDCQKQGGELHIPAHIEDMVTYMRKLDIGSRDVWIGYSDHYHEEEYVGIQGNKIESGWMKDQPKSKRPGDDCIVVKESKDDGFGMKVKDCDDENLYACDISDDFRSRHGTKA